MALGPGQRAEEESSLMQMSWNYCFCSFASRFEFQSLDFHFEFCFWSEDPWLPALSYFCDNGGQVKKRGRRVEGLNYTRFCRLRRTRDTWMKRKTMLFLSCIEDPPHPLSLSYRLKKRPNSRKLVSYLFTTISLYMRFMRSACHWQNPQLASINPRITTWPFDRASANGFSWPIVHEGGRWHIFLEPSVSTKNESKANRSWVATARMVTETGKDITTRILMWLFSLNIALYFRPTREPLFENNSLMQRRKSHLVPSPVTCMSCIKQTWSPRETRGIYTQI